MVLYLTGFVDMKIERDAAGLTPLREARKALMEKGHAVVCPILEGAYQDKDMTMYGPLIIRSDGVVLVGAVDPVDECRMAKEAGVPIYALAEAPDRHPLELECPFQIRGFMLILMRMYRTHLAKASDYSAANLLGTGRVGSVVRLWDKVARLMNLHGFKLQMEMAEFDAPKEPKNESVEDSFLDLANYGVLGLLLRRGLIGK